MGMPSFLIGLDEKTLHILDLTNGKAQSLTNTLSFGFCNFIVNKITRNEDADPRDYVFICYHTDGHVSQYNPESNDFEILKPSDSRINKEFLKEMFYLYR